MASDRNGANLGFESQLWAAADKLRGVPLTPSTLAGGKNNISSPSMGEGKGGGEYKDIPGFCKSATTEEIRSHGYVLTFGRYVGAEEAEDDGVPFEEKMAELAVQLKDQFTESTRRQKKSSDTARPSGKALLSSRNALFSRRMSSLNWCKPSEKMSQVYEMCLVR